MNTHLMLSLVVIVVLLTSVGGATAHYGAPAPAAPQAAAGSGFTFQGQLENAGAAVNGNCDMAFRLYDDAATGTPIGSAITTTVPVSNSLFTVMLNTGGEFGANAFDGAARWLDMAVRCPAGSGDYITLTPRQALTAAPYALFASNASNADLLDGQHASAFVTLSGAQTISGVKTFSDGVKFPDGTTQTTAFYRPALPGPGVATIVDSAGFVGEHTSIIIGADGLGLISYWDHTNGDLKVLHCGNVACNSGNISTTVDSAGNVGKYTSLIIGADGLGLISYHDEANGDLKVLHCGNATCTSGNISTTVDSAGEVGHDGTSLTIGADGLGLISYYDQTNANLKVLHCGNAACTGGNISTTVDSAGGVDQITSLTIGADGLGLISYSDGINADLKVLHCGNTACNSGNISTTVDNNTGALGEYPSITIGTDGLGLISYKINTINGGLKVLHCGNVACTSGNISTTVDTGGRYVGYWMSITIGEDGLGLISYNDASNGVNGVLKVMHCGNTACTDGNVATIVDSASWVGECTSIAIGADGLGLISYNDRTNGGLKVLHCGNAACTSGNISTTVDSAISVGFWTSITIGEDGLGLISYLDAANGSLKVIHCGNTACTGGNISTAVDSASFVGECNSIAIGADGLGLISYYDRTNGDLKVLHCGNRACTPYRVGR